MVGTIYITSRDAVFNGDPYQHTNLVFDEDGNPYTTGDQKVIRGGVANGGGLSGPIYIEVDRPNAVSADRIESEDPYVSRNFTTVYFGADAADKWADIVNYMKSLGTEVNDPNNPGQIAITPTFGYSLDKNACNTIVNTALIAGDLGSLRTNLPEKGGDLGSDQDFGYLRFPGGDSILGSDGNDTYYIPPDVESVLDQGGEDIYQIDASVERDFPLYIVEDLNSGTLDKIEVLNANPEDIRFIRDPNGDLYIFLPGSDGGPDIVIKDQFDDGFPKINTLWVFPPGGGTPQILALNDPSDFPLVTPSALPDWIPAVTEPYGVAPTISSPLVLDLDGDGVELSALNDAGSVYWDIDQDGFAEASAWIAGGDGLLCIDLNADGIINDHGELFGSLTTDGFTALSAYDTNSDDAITASDSQFGDLLVWVDANADGHSDETELHTLSELGITAVDLDASIVNYDIAGNPITHESSFIIGGNTRTIVDAWFAYDDVNTEYIGDYDLNVSALYLPDLRGYGELPDLRIAMSMDETLLTMVAEIASADLSDIFDPDYNFANRMREVMHRWAGSDGLDPGSRGGWIDARDLGFLEAFNGKPFFWDAEGIPNPIGINSAYPLAEAWHAAFDALQLRMLLQAAPGELFTVRPAYDPMMDTIDGSNATLNLVRIESFIGDHSGSDLQLVQAWLDVLGFIERTAGLSDLPAGDLDGLDDLIQASSLTHSLTLALLQEAIDGTGETPAGTSAGDLLLSTSQNETVYGQEGDDIMFGLAGGDTMFSHDGNNYLSGGDGDDTLWGAGGNDVLSGDGGNDQISGGGGNDVLTGGAGQDTLAGGAGDDEYVFAPGDGPGFINYDSISESPGEGTDTIRLKGVAPEDVRAWTVSNGSLYIQYYGVETIFVEGATGGSGESAVHTRIERIVFDNATVWDLTQGLVLIDTNASTTLYGSAQNDVLDGRGGDDFLYGFGGNDTYFYGSGLDTIYETGGTDSLRLSAGIGLEDISVSDYSTYDAKIIYNTGVDEIQIYSQRSGTAADHVENLVFDDGFTMDLANYTSWIYATGGAHSGGSGAETIIGGSSADTLSGNGGNDTIHGKGGNDTIEGGAGDDMLHGGNGTDTLTYANATAGVTVSLATTAAQNTGGAGTDSVFSFEKLTGSAYNDTLTGDAGANTINGGNGGDTIQGGDGNDTLNGGSGTDRVTYAAASAGVAVNLTTTTAQNTGGAGTDTLSNFENLTGSAFADVLTGTSSANSIDGGGGDDVIDGGAGNDTLIGGSGTDRLTYASATAGITLNLATTTGQATGGSGTDTISGFEHLTGSAYNDVLTGNSSANLIEGGAGDDTIDGAGGTDTLTYANVSAGVTVNLATATAQNTGGAGTDTISNFENLTGSAYNDTLTGNSSANVIEGGAGNDTMNGSGGTDTLTYANAAAGVTVNLATATAQNTGGAGTDTISSFENLTGSAFNDTLTGNSSANVIEGGAGNDTLNGAGGTDTLSYATAAAGVTVNLATTAAQGTGGAGIDTISNFENLTGSGFDDTLKGNSGANVIRGGNGNDRLIGGDGLDTLYGQSGADTFILQATSAFNNLDVVKDFTAGAGGDLLDLVDLLGSYDPLTEDIADFISLTTGSGNTFLAVDRDGTGGTYSAQNVAMIEGVTGLSVAGLLADANLVVPI